MSLKNSVRRKSSGTYYRPEMSLETEKEFTDISCINYTYEIKVRVYMFIRQTHL
jgi:hypothetical protein